MERILKRIDAVTKELENTKLCLWLKDENNVKEGRFEFIPSMLFFVLGFKDILNAMSIDKPKTKLDLGINTHCAEDLDRWKWYLRDLETLGFIPQSWRPDMRDLFTQICEEDSTVSRDLVYNIIHEVKKRNDPLISLVMIELLEAAFGVFIRNMIVPIERENMYERLQYFGKIRKEKEAAHSKGSWISEGRKNEEEIFTTHPLTEKQLKAAGEIISSIAPQFFKLFDYWYSMRHKFSRFVPQDNLSNKHEVEPA